MIRNFKALGLALVAVFAMSAVMASAASAGEFVFGTATKLTAVQDATGGNQVFTTTAGKVECNEVSGESTEFEKAKATGIEIVYKNSGGVKCKGPFGTEPTILTHKCHYKFFPGTSIGGAEMETEGSVELVGCKEEPKEITVNAPGCIIHVKEGQTLAPVKYRSPTVGTHDVTVEPLVTNIKYNHEGFLCGTGSAITGTYTGNVTIKGFNAGGTQVAIDVK